MIKKFTLDLIINDDTTVTNNISIVQNNVSTNKLLGDAFILKEDGIYIGHTDGYEINKKLLDSVLPLIPEIIDVQDKKLYRWPHLDLPRQKVDLIKEKYNCKVIRDVNKADIEIISINGMRKLMETNWNTSLNYQGLYNFLAFLKKSDMMTEDGLNKARLLLDGIPKESRIRINRLHNYNRTWDDNNNNPELKKTHELIETFLDDAQNYGGREVVIIDPDDIKTYSHLISTKSTLVYDVDINNIIDVDLAIINNTELENITQMITSSDRENRSLALEMLANCNVNKSFDVVSNIYYWHYDWLKDTNNWNTVNVKALRAKMKAFEGGGRRANIYCYNNYIKNLINFDKLTQFAIDDTRNKMYDSLIEPLAGQSDNLVFDIDLESLQLKEKFNESIQYEK
tara:strand:- start:1185 stop:2378 length:1194 start_codon:yes stop_codon:yes gene_type:complete